MISPRSIRFQLLAAVNTAMVLLLGVFLIVDYRREIEERVLEKHIALEDETRTLVPAVSRVRLHGDDAVQGYIDEVCGQMQDSVSPGHHIAVRLNETVLQARAHHRASPEIFEAMQQGAQSPAHRAEAGDEELVVASSRQGDLTVYVSEYLTDIRRAARWRILRRLPRILLMAVVAAVVVNVVFLRMAARPLRQLVHTVRQIAEGNLGAQTGPFAAEEFTHLGEAVNSMSVSLAEADRRRQYEMTRARHIQQQLLPDRVDAPGLTFAHVYQPAEEVAGDFYDVLRLPDETWLVSLADVTGHGVPAAMSAMMLKALLLNAAEHHADPGGILGFINHRLATVCRTENMASMFVARCDLEARVLEYASAGHENGLLLPPAGRLRELPATGLLLAVMDDATWKTETLEVSSGDRLLIVTDGITEAMNARGEQFGRRTLAHLFEQCRSTSIQETVVKIGDAVSKHCLGHEQADDITMLAFEFSPAST